MAAREEASLHRGVEALLGAQPVASQRIDGRLDEHRPAVGQLGHPVGGERVPAGDVALPDDTRSDEPLDRGDHSGLIVRRIGRHRS